MAPGRAEMAPFCVSRRSPARKVGGNPVRLHLESPPAVSGGRDLPQQGEPVGFHSTTKTTPLPSSPPWVEAYVYRPGLENVCSNVGLWV